MNVQHGARAAQQPRGAMKPPDGDTDAFGDDFRARRLRSAEHHIREARRELLAARLPPCQWAVARADVAALAEIALSCADFAESYEWADVDRRTA